MTLRASCLCQGIAFEIDGTVRDMLLCHCSMCRKVHGAAVRARNRAQTVQIRQFATAAVNCSTSLPAHAQHGSHLAQQTPPRPHHAASL